MVDATDASGLQSEGIVSIAEITEGGGGGGAITIPPQFIADAVAVMIGGAVATQAVLDPPVGLSDIDPRDLARICNMGICGSLLAMLLWQLARAIPIVRVIPRTDDRDDEGGCKIDVRSYGVLGGSSFALIPQHTFIVFTDVNNQEFLFRGGPEFGALNPNQGQPSRCPNIDNSSGNSYGAVTVLEPHPYGEIYRGVFRDSSNEFRVDYTHPNIRSRTVMSSKSACDKLPNLINETVRINQSCTLYNRNGPNSNSVISTMLLSSAIPMLKPLGFAPGWGHPI